MDMGRYCIFIILLLTTVVTISAQKLSVNAPRHVGVGEQFQIVYYVNTQDAKDFRLENIPDGINILYGPSTSSQSSFQFVNGHMRSSSSVTYSFLAVAKKKGNFALPVARVNVDGKTIVSPTLHISASGETQDVSSNGNSVNVGGQPDGEDASSYHKPQISKTSSDDVFIRVTASRKRVHEQEPVLLTYKVYTIPSLVNLDYKMPELKGFHTQEVPLPKSKSFHKETLDGQVYDCVVWSQFVLYPQITGKLEIPSLTFHGSIMRERRAPFAFITGGGYEEEKREIKAPGVTIQVDKLPAKPDGFSGGVGHFDISAQLSKKEVKAGDPVNLRLVISGTGNLKLIKQPEVAFPQDWDKYDAKVMDKTHLTTSGVEGNMVYDILAVPRKEGTYTIAPVKLVYYDTAAGSYRTIQTQPLAVNVMKGNGTSSVNDFSLQKEEDIRPIKTGKARLHDVNDIFFDTVWYWMILAALFVVFGTLLYMFRRTTIEHTDVVKMRGKNANKVATRHLKKANGLMLANRPSEFYDEVLHALWGYVSDKLNMSAGQLSRDNISEQLAAHNVPGETIEKFIGALDECEFERYAPGDAKGNMNRTFEAAMSAIADTEDTLKRAGRDGRVKVRTILAVTVMIFPLAVSAITKDNADTEYKKGNYQQAIKDYEELLSNGVSYEIYYNLGNAYYRIDNIPRAILSYERALQISPYDDDVRFNLKMAQSKTIDKITPESEMFFVTWYKAFVSIMSVDGWARTAVVSVVLAIILVLAYLFSGRIWMRKVGFYGGVVTLLLFVLANVSAFQQRSRLRDKIGAIVISSASTVKKSPVEGSSDNFVIHEGTKVEILDRSVKNWVDIRIADGREGWIEASKIEEI